MASIFKRTYTAKGKDGKPLTGPDGKPVRRECSHYTIQYEDAGGRKLRVRGYKDKGATLQLAAKLERDRARGEQGLADPFSVHRSRPLAGHVSDYVSHLRTAGRDPMYVYNADKRMAVLLRECGWKLLAEIEPNSFGRWRERRRTVPAKVGRQKTKVLSARTVNQYQDILGAFLNWCVDQNRLGANPLARVPKVQGEPVRKRRAISDDDFARVLAVAPEDRRFAWEVLLTTGLRVQELKDLEWQDVHLGPRPYLSLRASKVKSRREQMLPLRSDLAKKLADHKPAGAGPSDRVFVRVPSLQSWKKDLAAAGVAYQDGAGRQADRHSMRTMLGTRLQRAGVPIRVAMELMRHSDIRLTTKVYTDPQAFDLAGAVECLPPVTAAEKPPEKKEGQAEGEGKKGPRLAAG